jgi:transglutaminase-like putative cysteine protease
VIYAVRHVTTYDYALPVSAAQCILRLTPVSRPGQIVHAATLTLQPAPIRRQDSSDTFGNRLTLINLAGPHRSLTLTLDARITVEPPAALNASDTAPWEEVALEAARSTDLAMGSPAHMLYPARFTPLEAGATAYARESFPHGRPVLEGAMDLMRRIKADFAYDPRATDVSTPLAEAFAKRRGVCQDFAQIMIAGLRGLGLPVAYVSGYLRTDPPPGKPRLAGADATHAWVSVWCGQAGWVGLDPTNAIRAGSDHIVLAIGRDYADVAPVSGIITTAGDQRINVQVDVVPIGSAQPQPQRAQTR